MLVECGFVRATLGDGAEFTFTPSLGRIATLGAPRELVAMFAALYGPNAEKAAAYVLAGLCDQEDPAPLIGALEPGGTPEAPDALQLVPGEMPPAEMVLIARHLMQHGIVGSAKPGQGGGARRRQRSTGQIAWDNSAILHSTIIGSLPASPRLKTVPE